MSSFNYKINTLKFIDSDEENCIYKFGVTEDFGYGYTNKIGIMAEFKEDGKIYFNFD